jgi:hypothetical protein
MRTLFALTIVFLAINANAKKLTISGNQKSLAGYLPPPLKALLPKQLLTDLQKLTTKDIDAAHRVAERWPEFSTLNNFEHIVGEESKPLKTFIDDLITTGHQHIDATVAKMDENQVKFFQKVRLARF